MSHEIRHVVNRRWLGYLAAAVVFAIACVGLGKWQLNRHEEKHAEVVHLNENYDAHPVAVDTVLPDLDSSLPKSAKWQRVKMTGTYDTDDTMLARNRPMNGKSGYHVVVPLRLNDGNAILVDRGWIPTDADGGVPNQVPQPKSGSVTVVARMKPAQPDTGKDSPPGQLTAINPDTVSVGYPLYQGAYVQLQSENPAATTTPTAPKKPSISGGVNLSYALQWFCFGTLALLAFIYAIRQEIRRKREDAELDEAIADGRLDPADLPESKQQRAPERRNTSRPTSNQVRAPKRTKKRRTSEDEEDEILQRQGY